MAGIGSTCVAICLLALLLHSVPAHQALLAAFVLVPVVLLGTCAAIAVAPVRYVTNIHINRKCPIFSSRPATYVEDEHSQ